MRQIAQNKKVHQNIPKVEGKHLWGIAMWLIAWGNQQLFMGIHGFGMLLNFWVSYLYTSAFKFP